MSLSSVTDLLRGCAFVEGLPDQHIWHLARAGEIADFPTDATLFQQGEPRRLMAIIVEGSVAIEKGHDGLTTRMTTLGAGDAVGEGLLLDDEEHGTTARCLGPVRAFVFEKTALQKLLKDQPAIYAALVGRSARTISRRLARVDATIVGRGRALGFGGVRMRTEADLLGERQVPEEALYGIQTLRATENFPITGVTLRDFPRLIEALAAVKEAAALANRDLGLLDADTADLIARAAREVRSGRHHEHFLVDMIQGGAGTSTNMNANEVIANRALELAGRPRGDYAFLSPNNHVNRSQSTNDVYPTAIRLALHASIEELRDAMRAIALAFKAKGAEFGGLLKMGRTQMQDAVPMTLGQEFTAFGVTILEDVERLAEVQALIREINMGATAIGTGLNTPDGWAEAVRAHLAEITGLTLVTAPDLVEATSDTGAFVQVSGVLKRCAVKLSKIASDLRLLSSGPRTGFGEINLPAVQPGSSIMPGKVNPVIPEVMNQVCFDIVGCDVTVTLAAEAGQLQLNAFEPIMAFRLLRGVSELRNACVVLREKCVEGITANPDRLRQLLDASVGIVTALVPHIGYEVGTDVAKEALATGKGVREIVLSRGLMTEEALEKALEPARLAGITRTTPVAGTPAVQRPEKG
jgi:aspartate ammonia-lyase